MASLKQLVRSPITGALRRLGLELVKYAGPRDHPPDLVGLLADQAMQNDPSLKFLQIGANDGVREDPIRAAVVKHRPAGVLVEPLPDVFAKLRENYAGFDRLAFENVAIADAPGELVLYRVRGAAEVPDFLHGAASFSRDNLLKHRRHAPQIERHIQTVSVPTTTVAQLVTKHNLQDARLLLIDTEGYDAIVLRSALDAGLRPELICYEHVHLDPDAIDRCARRLVAEGYGLCQLGINTLAVRAG